MQISPFLFRLNSPAPRAVIELTKCWYKWDCSGARGFFKNALPFTSLCKYCKGCDNHTRDELMSMTLRMIMMIIMSDSGSTYHNCFCDFLAVWNHTISLSSSMFSLLWKSLKEKVAIFSNNHDCVYICYMQLYCLTCQKRCFVSFKVWQCVNWKYFSNTKFLLMSNEWFSLWLESVEFLLAAWFRRPV